MNECSINEAIDGFLSLRRSAFRDRDGLSQTHDVPLFDLQAQERAHSQSPREPRQIANAGTQGNVEHGTSSRADSGTTVSARERYASGACDDLLRRLGFEASALCGPARGSGQRERPGFQIVHETKQNKKREEDNPGDLSNDEDERQ